MRKILVLIAAFLLLPCLVYAEDIYIAQTAQGGNTGADCANAHVTSWFNTSGNWGEGTGKIGPGDTAHLCGTITSWLTAQASGSNGSPITIKFEDGAKMSQTAMNGNFLNIDNRSYIVVDGGTNGVIENTANGALLANHIESRGITAAECNYCEIKNLTISNLYVAVSGQNVGMDWTLNNAIYGNGDSLYIHDNVIHDVGWAIRIDYNQDNDLKIYNNTIYHSDHALAISGSNGNNLTGAIIRNNHIYSYDNWDTPGCDAHHDGIHIYGVPTAAFTGLDFYNNLLEGPVGSCITGHVFVESGSSTAQLSNSRWFNNVLLSDAPALSGLFGLYSGISGTTEVYNNTIVGSGTSSGLCFSLSSLTGLKFKNNIASNCQQLVGINASSGEDIDYNLYGLGSSSNAFSWNDTYVGGANASGFLAWKSASSGDSHGIQNSSPGLQSDGSLLPTSPAKDVGVDLFSLSIAALNFDTLGVPRPQGLRWDMGAKEYSTGAPDTAQPVITDFSIPATSNSLSIEVFNLAGTDNVGITKFMLTETSTVPLINNPNWVSVTSATVFSIGSWFTFSSPGLKTLYAWLADAAGNISASWNVTTFITLPVPASGEIVFGTGSGSIDIQPSGSGEFVMQ